MKAETKVKPVVYYTGRAEIVGSDKKYRRAKIYGVKNHPVLGSMLETAEFAHTSFVQDYTADPHTGEVTSVLTMNTIYKKAIE